MSDHNQGSHRFDADLPSLTPIHGGHHRCSECGRIIYSDPKVAVAAIIPIDDGIVLLKRAIEPNLGMWSFPSGYVDRAEKLENALQREVAEECGLTVEVGDLVGVYSDEGEAVILVVYQAIPVGGKLQAGDETSDARVFPIESMPRLAFEHDNRIVNDWLKANATRDSA